MGIISLVVETLGVLAIVISLLAVARSNQRVQNVERLSTLQSMVVEMNSLRQVRAANPDLERSLFESRADWSDSHIQNNLVAVQLANILEWAFLARRDRLIEKDVWESWVQTWRNVIMSSKSLKATFKDSVWTFGRHTAVQPVLYEIIWGKSDIPDPARSQSRFLAWITGT